jgi:hypothetical protein
MGRILLGIIVGILLVPAAVLAWLHYGQLPVAVADTPFPQERMLTHEALDKRIDRELIKTPPIQADEGTFVAGAQIYHDQCASCHGFHLKPSAFGPHMYPDAPPLWERHHDGKVVGVSDDPPGETYWKAAFGHAILQDDLDRHADLAGEPAAGQCRQADAAGGDGLAWRRCQLWSGCARHSLSRPSAADQVIRAGPAGPAQRGETDG